MSVRKLRFVLLSAFVLTAANLGAQTPEIPLHHGCGSLVWSPGAGWEHRIDSSALSAYPRYYHFEGGLGHGLKTVTEYDADSVALRQWKVSLVLGGLAVEQAPFGRRIYQIDSCGRVVSVRYETLDGEERPAPGISFRTAGPEMPSQSGEALLFNASGCFCGLSEGESGTLVYDSGFGAERLIINFADPVQDPPQVGPGTAVEFVSAGDVHYSLRKVGAYDRKHHGLIAGIVYLKRESEYYGLLDFARNGEHPLHPGVYYVAWTKKEGAVAHNNVNFGNFLWGAAAQAAGVPLWIARLGAHISNMMHTGGRPDSKDDQLSISAGYHFSKAIGKGPKAAR